MIEKIKVLFIDDDIEDFVIVSKLLSKSKRIEFSIEQCEKYDDAIEKIKENKHDVYLVDYILGIKNGVDLLKEVNEFCVKKPFIILTGQKNNNIDMLAMENGAIDYLVKDQIDANMIERSIKYSIERKKLEKNLRNEKIIKEMIIEKTIIGLCLVDALSDSIIDVNPSFLKMFNLDKQFVINSKFHNLLDINQYEGNLYENKFNKKHICRIKSCPCLKAPIECRIISKNNGVFKDCLMSCASVKLNNGDNRILRFVSIMDITKQKYSEKKLIETTKELQGKIKDFGIKNEDPKVILGLIDTEVNKLKNIEELALKWTG
jgi:FixJ family two-component response regulator